MTAMSPLTKAARLAQIAGILAHAQVRSQEELAELLAQRGVRVAQATLSRDLEELGAVRLRGPGGTLVYALPGEPGGPGSLPGGPAGDAGGMAAGAGVRTGGPARGGAVPGRGGAVPGREGPGRAARHGGAARGGAGPGGAARGGAGPGGAGPGGAGYGGAGYGGGGYGGGGYGGAAGPGRAGRRGTNGTTGPEPHRGALARVAPELLVSAEASANLVVLRTPAGGAQLLASAIDHAEWASILGTVAGDDTVLVIARDPAGGGEVARQLLRLAERRLT